MPTINPFQKESKSVLIERQQVDKVDSVTSSVLRLSPDRLTQSRSADAQRVRYPNRHKEQWLTVPFVCLSAAVSALIRLAGGPPAGGWPHQAGDEGPALSSLAKVCMQTLCGCWAPRGFDWHVCGVLFCWHCTERAQSSPVEVRFPPCLIRGETQGPDNTFISAFVMWSLRWCRLRWQRPLVKVSMAENSERVDQGKICHLNNQMESVLSFLLFFFFYTKKTKN